MLLKDIKELPIISNGAGRYVYDYGDQVIKIPKNFKETSKYPSFSDTPQKERSRVMQNIVELEVFLNCPARLKYLLCDIPYYFYVEDIPIIFQKKMKTFNSKEADYFRNYGKRNKLEAFCHKNNLKNYDQLEKDIRELSNIFELELKEILTNWRNWGYDEEGIKLIDYGCLKREVRQKHYRNGYKVVMK